MMGYLGRNSLIGGMALALVAAFNGHAANAAGDVIELKMAHYLPTANGMHEDFMEPWARELEKRTNGKVKVTIYPGGTQLGNIAKLYDEVRSGVVDIAHGLRGVPNGRFKKTSIIELPFMSSSADAASRTLWALYPQYLKDEYPGVKMLALHAHNGGLLHTGSKPIQTMDDLKGLRIRFPSGPIKALLEEWGATPQGLPPGKVYESVQKGVIDGSLLPWDPINSFKLSEVMNYHTDVGGVYTVSFWFAMNERKYNSLPADVRKAIDDISGDNLIGKFGGWWNRWDKLGKDLAVAKGDPITVLDKQEQAKWEKAAEPVIDEWLSKLEDDGVDNAREIYKAMKDKVAEYEG
ncbi:TRAP transporter substrate-binding protein [Aestuariispira ectoiniformans]|uniref:TRAP transporter substrate-binding protein n=1 Tax=Aestuariispira ectoiniformans TaxID=2775080 RepID=UPI00223B8D1E|nr:TRAP transporter substrate-binding protein [Aestuariispira ectoiniformans]